MDRVAGDPAHRFDPGHFNHVLGARRQRLADPHDDPVEQRRLGGQRPFLDRTGRRQGPTPASRGISHPADRIGSGHRIGPGDGVGADPDGGRVRQLRGVGLGSPAVEGIVELFRHDGLDFDVGRVREASDPRLGNRQRLIRVQLLGEGDHDRQRVVLGERLNPGGDGVVFEGPDLADGVAAGGQSRGVEHFPGVEPVVAVLVEGSGHDELAGRERPEREPAGRVGGGPVRQAVGQEERLDEGPRRWAGGGPIDHAARNEAGRDRCAGREGDDPAGLAPVGAEVGKAVQQLDPVDPVGFPTLARPHRDPASLPSDDRHFLRRRQDDQPLEVAGAKSKVGAGAFADHFVEPKLGLAFEPGRHDGGLGDGPENDGSRGVGRTARRFPHAGAGQQHQQGEPGEPPHDEHPSRPRLPSSTAA